MPDLILIYWRDIPAQVLVRAGRAAAKRQLAPRFQAAIDRAAMRAGARDTDAYLADWRRADPVAVEGDLDGTLGAGHRLACQARLCGDVVVDVPASSQVHRQVVRKSVDERPIAVDPVVHLHYVEVAPPEMSEPSGDARRLLAALGSEWG